MYKENKLLVKFFQLNEQKTITEYFAEMEDLDLSLLADEVEEMESKRIKLSE